MTMRTGVCIGLVLAPVLALLGCYEANDPASRPGVLVSPTSGLVTSEAGGTATFTVVLATAPTADVVIDLASTDTGEGTVLPIQLTFTPADWNIAQTVTVTGADDAVMDGIIAYTITTALTSTDPDYGVMDPADVSVTNLDDDVAGIMINFAPPTGLTTREAATGNTAQFTVALNSEPTANVDVTFTSSDTGEGRLSGAPPYTYTVTFTPLNWFTAQAITITGVDDADTDGDIAYTIQSAASSADSNYNGLTGAQVPVTNIDNDIPGMQVTPGLTLTLGEGTSGQLFVALTCLPTADVVIQVSSQDTNEVTVSPPTLTFTTANWSTPQPVTVTAVNDGIVEGSTEDWNVTFSVVDASSAPEYGSVTDEVAVVTVVDAGEVWTKYGSNPVVTTGAAGMWNAKYVQEPSVLPAAGPSYVMWYEGQKTGSKQERIGRATSSDGYTLWTDDAGNPVFSNSGSGFDKAGVGDPCMVLVGTTYMMWYGGRQNAATKDKIGLATSPTGYDNWTRNANPVLTGTAAQWDSTGVGSPHVLYNAADATTPYRMWYTGNVGGTRRIGYATSTNGTSWVKPLATPVLDVGAAGQFDSNGVMMACVILDGTTYRMWYTGLAADGLYRIGYATSTNGTTWVKDAGNPVLLPGAATSWDEAGVLAPWVIKEGTTLKMWYTGVNAGGTYRIGYATKND